MNFSFLLITSDGVLVTIGLPEKKGLGVVVFANFCGVHPHTRDFIVLT